VLIHDTFVPVEVLADQATNGGGSLARTGNDARGLGSIGVLLLGIGAALTLASRIRLRRRPA
jgi:hypothetical protein